MNFHFLHKKFILIGKIIIFYNLLFYLQEDNLIYDRLILMCKFNNFVIYIYQN